MIRSSRDSRLRYFPFRLCLTVIGLLFASSPRFARAQFTVDDYIVHGVKLEAAPSHPIPSPEVTRKWWQDLGSILLQFSSKADCDRFLDSLRSDSSVQANELAALQKAVIQIDDGVTTTSWKGVDFNHPVQGTVIFLEANEQRGLSQATLNRLFARQNKVGSLNGFSAKSKGDMRTLLQDLGLRDEVSIERLIAKGFEDDRGFSIGFTADVVASLGEETQALIRERSINRPHNQGLEIQVTFKTREALRSYAEHLSLERWPSLLGHLTRLERDARFPLTVKLEKILPELPSARLNTYSACSGPNCFNTGLHFSSSRDAVLDYTSGDDLLKNLNRDYVPVTWPQAPQFGDVLLYSDLAGTPIHVASFIGGPIVFTKNGFLKHSAYIFQELRAVEETYLSEYGKYRFHVLRKRPNGSHGEESTAPIEPYIKTYSVHLAKLGLSPWRSDEQIRKSLLRLSERRISVAEEWFLNSLRFEPRYVGHLPLIQSILATRAKYPDKLKLEKIDFYPTASIEENLRGLNRLLSLEHLSADQREALRWVKKMMPESYTRTLEKLDQKFSLWIAPSSRTCEGVFSARVTQ